jgi:hypothetical protein
VVLPLRLGSGPRLIAILRQRKRSRRQEIRDLCRIVANGTQFRPVPDRGTRTKKAVNCAILPFELYGLLLFSTTPRQSTLALRLYPFPATGIHTLAVADSQGEVDSQASIKALSDEHTTRRQVT